MVSTHDFSTQVSADNQRAVVFVAEMWRDGQLAATSVTPFVANKHLELRKPGLKTQVSVEDRTLHVDVSARSLARFVELSLEGADVVFSDNYFDLPAGRSVRISAPLPEGWSAAQAESALKVQSLYDSYA